MRTFERVLKFVLGKDFWYEAGFVGPDFDLFLWALLMLRYNMALQIWSKFPDSPVRSALLASTLYRKWAAMPDVKPHVAIAMLDMAAEFENIAVEVQQRQRGQCLRPWMPWEPMMGAWASGLG